MKRVLLLLAFMVAVGVTANAATVGLTPGEANNLLLLSGTGAPTFVDTGLNTYTVAWNEAVVGVNTANIGINFMVPRGAAGDTFEVLVANDDENAWDFAVSLNGVVSPFVSIASNGSHLFSVAVTGPVNQFALVLRGNLPLNGDDRTAEFRVNPNSPIPEPMSILLLGSGLVGLGGALRRKLR